MWIGYWHECYAESVMRLCQFGFAGLAPVRPLKNLRHLPGEEKGCVNDESRSEVFCPQESAGRCPAYCG